MSCSTVLIVHAAPSAVRFPYRLPSANASLILNWAGRGHLAVAHLARRDVHVGVAGDRHHLDVFPVGRDVDDHQRVGLVGDQARAVLTAHARGQPGVRPEDDDVLRLRVQVDGPLTEQAADVNLLDVVVEVPQYRVAGHNEPDDQHDQNARYPGYGLAMPPRQPFSHAK